MPNEPYVVWLEGCTSDGLSRVGGKAMALGSLMREGFQVPNGFAVSTLAYREHIAHNRLRADIERLLHESDSLAAQHDASDEIARLFQHSRPSPRLEDELLRAHEQLCSATSLEQPMAVRSSATAEDLADASFAGQQETYLWIIGGEQVLQHVVRCWASLFTPQAIAYRAHLGTPIPDLAMGVVVQCMVPAEAAGVMLTIDPVNGDRSAIAIEASYGLGAAVVNGEVTPDRFCVDKVVLEIRSRTLGSKTHAYRFEPAVQGTRLAPVPPEQQAQACLTDDEVVGLATLGKRMERAMGRPQDMEWAIGPGRASPREIFLLQARPETVWSAKERSPVSAGVSSVMAGILRSMHVSVDEPAEPFAVAGVRNFGWVRPGVLARGEQPPLENGTFEQLRELGIRTVVSLRPDREPARRSGRIFWPEYRVDEERRVVEQAGLRFSHLPLEDFAAPSPSEVAAALRLLDAEVARSPAVYVHCRAGAGRAALVTGAWMVSHGESGDRAAALYERFMHHLVASRGTPADQVAEMFERVGQPFVWWAIREVLRALGSPVTRDIPSILPARRPPNADGWEHGYDEALRPWRDRR